MILGMMYNMPAKDRTLTKFGLNVARLRAAKGFTQEKLAEKADVDRTYVSRIETDDRNLDLGHQFRNSKLPQVIECRIIEIR